MDKSIPTIQLKGISYHFNRKDELLIQVDEPTNRYQFSDLKNLDKFQQVFGIVPPAEALRQNSLLLKLLWLVLGFDPLKEHGKICRYANEQRENQTMNKHRPKRCHRKHRL